MNKALLGCLTKDHEIRYTSNNIPKAIFHLAVHRRYTNKDGMQTPPMNNAAAGAVPVPDEEIPF